VTGQLTDDCFASGGALTPLGEALALLSARVAPIAVPERVPIAAAGARILAEDVVADRSVPPHDNAAVDGYAVAFDDLDPAGATRLPVAGRIAAGHPLGRPPRRGEALHVLTGAAMPEGPGAPDTVFMQEDVRLEGDTVVLPPGIRRGANYRLAGEDIAAGDRVIAAGRRLRPQDVGLIASLGRAEATVYRPLRVAVLSTGDEVTEPGRPVGPGGIYDANRPALIAMLARLGIAVQVVEKVLNHRSGSIRGVAAVYNRYEYGDEKRAALEAWARFVVDLVGEGQGGNVGAMRAKA